MNGKTIGTAIVACLAAFAPVSPASGSIAGHSLLHELPSCAKVDLYRTCRVDLPNGDFSGGDGDGYYHGTSSFAGFFGGVHSVRAHLQPWIYASRGVATYLERPAQDLRLTLWRPSDHVYQWIPLTPDRPHDSYFVVHAHVASTGGQARVAIQLRLPDGWPEHDVVEEAQTTTVDGPGDELVATLRVPAGTRASRIGVAIRAGAGSVPVIVDDVVLVRSATSRLPVELSRDDG
ncbi:hypothetical protein [Luteibacter sp. CQ10]|uniref:hypothetical protein n=1 Tax=Luteibacter sp. CQ10 TaxID=2805821 RepID=UPI0034A4EFDE